MTNQQGALQYADRDHMDLGSYYMRHVSAMTGEALHSKSAIAAELAHRDREIDRLQAENANLNAGYAAARLEIESLRARSVAPAGEYPTLPEPFCNAHSDADSEWPDMFSASQMHAYVDADRAMRAVQPASGLDPELGPMLDFANAGEIAFYDYAVAQHCRATLDILDGKDNGAGACSAPWASVRKRLLSIVELHQSSSASQGDAQEPGVAYAAQRASIPCGPLIDNFPPRPEPAIWHEGGGFYNIYQLELFANATHALRAARVPADSVTAPAGERENLDLRRMLCVAHAGAAAYMDDGEAQDNRDLPLIDFLRDTPAEIQDKLQRRALKKLAAEATAPAAQAADSVLEDAARLDWLLLHISGEEFRRIGVHYSGNASRADVDAARKQGANHD